MRQFRYLILFFCTFLGCLVASDEAYLRTNALEQDQIQLIDREIERVQRDLKHYRLEVMQAEVESETYMKNEWSEYVKEIQEAEENVLKVKKLEQYLRDLQERRAALLEKVPLKG